MDKEMRRLFDIWIHAARYRCPSAIRDAEISLYQYVYGYAYGDDRKLKQARDWIEHQLKVVYSE